jgi:anti-sigma factor RsiW
MTCREVADFVGDYVSGDLPDATRRRFDWHLVTCRNCRRYLATYRATIAAGRTAFARPDADADGMVPEELIRAILAAQPPSPGA